MPSNVWRGQLTFGLVSVPVKLLRAARKERVPLHYLHRSEPGPQVPEPLTLAAPSVRTESYDPEPPTPVSRVRQTLSTTEDDRPVSRADIVKGYEVEPDRYVVLDPAEIKGLQRRTSTTMEIVRSVKLSEIDPVFFETSYYVVPDRGGEKSYSLLFAALRATGHVAIARVGMYGREHVIIIRPGEHGMIAHTMFYTGEIRFDNEFHADVQSISDKELDLAKMFLQALEGPFAPEEFKDVYREELQAIIAKKTVESAPAAAASAAAPAVPPVDILEALKKSIAMRKPPTSESQPPQAEAGPKRKSGRAR